MKFLKLNLTVLHIGKFFSAYKAKIWHKVQKPEKCQVDHPKTTTSPFISVSFFSIVACFHNFRMVVYSKLQRFVQYRDL